MSSPPHRNREVPQPMTTMRHTDTPVLDPWPAPTPTQPVDATVHIPGSKSLTNRYLVLAALSDRPSTVHGVLDSRDSRLMIEALRTLGVAIEPDADRPDTVQVTPMPEVHAETAMERTVDCGLAGTVMRFLPPVAALTGYTVTIDGDPEARVRPMAPVLEGLVQAGAHVERLDAVSGTPTQLPLRVRGNGFVNGGEVTIDAGGSSQFISALLLAGARFRHGLHLRHTGERTPSPEHVGMTVSVLRQAGVVVDDTTPGQWVIAPGPISGGEWTVESDLSNAGPYLCAAVATGGTVRIPHWPAHTTQIGDRWREILPRFGATVTFTPDPGTEHGTLTVAGSRDESGVPVVTGGGEISDTAELAPTVAALAALAQGETHLTKIGHLRGHETDRLSALTAEIRRLGGTIEEHPDRLDITGAGPSGLTAAQMETYHDHRMATFAAVIGLVVPGVSIENVGTTSKTMPRFPQAWSTMAETAETSAPTTVIHG
ncbi:3-phosphoshikimate 1-carboxyvinyltransferase [Citricoccus muralis]|uniref:3-phosphoshikimate 1-carboxyvinyltransferase n=1 Tax=Citricoccus muralis TaxID=169134 RepID=A0ABY8H9X7_9MICC|nr:3-phosphoshikimate 1-carboxyvinyltransferase [Citricoccus muralis]WFP17654.1 3-phosphoshikimate 1-carboxyvinyltransferase [Citricoccus muralis]